MDQIVVKVEPAVEYESAQNVGKRKVVQVQTVGETTNKPEED